MAEKLSFEEWMKQVDRVFGIATGMSTADVEDFPYRDWYEDGIRPARAANDVIKSLRYAGEF